MWSKKYDLAAKQITIVSTQSNLKSGHGVGTTAVYSNHSDAKNLDFIFTQKCATNRLIKHQNFNTKTDLPWWIKNKMHLFCFAEISQTMVISRSNPGLNVAGLSAVKKLLWHRVCAVNNVLVPGYNRRSHSKSHTNSITYQHRKLSKTFGYIAKKTLRFWIGLVLATCYGDTAVNAHTNTKFPFPFILQCELKSVVPRQEHVDLNVNKYGVNSARLNFCQKSTPLLVNTIETRAAVLLWRTQMCKSVFHARQVINHEEFKCKWQNVVPLNKGCCLKLRPYDQNKTQFDNVNNVKLKCYNTMHQNVYYTVKPYSNWVYCGTTLRN